MATITVKGIPDELYQRLKVAAEASHRSVNSEIITRIERSLMPHRATAQQLLQRVQRLQESYAGRVLKLEDLEAARQAGRP
jgi:plasmid stability protein